MTAYKYSENLLFNLCLPGNDGPQSRKFKEEFHKKIGVKISGGYWGEISLDSPRIGEFISSVKDAQKTEGAVFNGLCMLQQTLRNKISEWYEVVPKASAWEFMKENRIGTDNVYSINAHNAICASSASSAGFGNPIVNDKFKSFVESEKSSGIDFLWMKDTGKYKAPQWHIPIASTPIGKGVSHSWFDPRKRRGSDSWQCTNEPFINGVFAFDSDQITDYNLIEPRITRDIIGLFSTHKLAIRTVKKYLRNELPKTDFAYNWRQEDSIRDGINSRQRGLCVNHDTKERLIKAGVLGTGEFEPVEIVDTDENPPNIKTTDRSYPCPMYEKIRLQELKEQLHKCRLSMRPKSDPKSDITFKQVLSLLKKKKQAFPESFQKPFKACIQGIPGDYAELLKFSNGMNLGMEAELLKQEELDFFNDECNSLIKDYGEETSSYFHFGKSISGDWYSINNSSESPDFGRIFRFSHETTATEHSWKNMAVFIHEILTGFYD